MVALGCDLLQGFLLGRPVEADAVLAAHEGRPGPGTPPR
jgi:EAL domain-containing protein (putative c-di-GMP-specific phosphodiesterase class I)